MWSVKQDRNLLSKHDYSTKSEVAHLHHRAGVPEYYQPGWKAKKLFLLGNETSIFTMCNIMIDKAANLVCPGLTELGLLGSAVVS